MTNLTSSASRSAMSCKPALAAVLAALLGGNLLAAPATLLFEDDFHGGIPGWTAVQPAGGVYLDGPMLWQYDLVSGAFVEQSNIYTDSATFSGSRIAVMLINDTVAPANFTYTARLTAGDDDAFGLIWGYEGEGSFYRVTFARQNRALSGWPYQGWVVDRMNNGQITDLFGPDNSTFINTAGQPFDVTISVNNGLLTLTLVDDPAGAALVYNLVTGGALPTAPSARVGMFSWGMSGNSPRGFRIQNPVLSPTPLTGDPGSVLPNWSFLIPPRADGTINMNSALPPMWSMGFDANGATGTMFENSDTFLNADNNANGTTNFAAPSAVAGEATWSNYVYTARLRSEDDDGVGLLFRYLNETNFYRIGFRSQNSTSGVKRGVSIQKNVDLNFDQIYAGTDFIYQPGVPFDVHVSIQTNRLQVLVVNNPDSTAAQGYSFGPFDIIAPTVDQGKIGVFSWAQYSAVTARDSGTEVDSVAVHEVTGEGLIVNSPYGTPNPPLGLNDFPVSSVITASVDNVVVSAPGVRQVLTGWSGFGSVPPSGTTNEVVFTLSSLSLLTWNWQTEYLLSTAADAGGSISVGAGPWIPEGSNVTVTVMANPGYIFTGWSGDTISTATNLSFAMLRPITLTANFAADSDNDGLPDSWEMRYFGNLSQDGSGDPDTDGDSNAVEYQRGTNPNHAETLVASDGLNSQWVNTQRDPGLMGELTVVDFGSGYRGAFGNDNEFRYANDFAFIPANNGADLASFQSQRLIVRSNLWNATWGTNFSASGEFSVGDNDGVCFYFRYMNESNWYRVTLCGEDPVGSLVRPDLGLSIQRRVNGLYSVITPSSLLGPLYAAYTDPTDADLNIVRPANTPAGFKRVRVTVSATNENFEVRVIGWNAFLPTPDFDPSAELIAGFTDASLPSGRIGFGFWGEGGFGNNQNQINGIPIPDGAFIDNILVKSPADGAVVLSEDWESAAMADQFPAGWENPFLGDPNLEGQWVVNADGSISQLSNQGLNTTGTAAAAKADADGPVLIAPDAMSANYYLKAGFHQFDDDGVGIVYDFQDTNNYSRVIFRREATYNGAIPPGLSVSRKSGGVWTDISAGDPSFLFTPGRPFEIELSNNNGEYNLVARDVEDPALMGKWHWTGTPATATNRFGVTTWASQSAHVLYVRAYDLPELTVENPFAITRITLDTGNVVLEISKPAGARYNVQRASTLDGPFLPVATDRTEAQYSEPAPTGGAFYRLELVQ